MSNTFYKSRLLSEKYSTHRTSWDEFYSSEKHVLELITNNPHNNVLDLGCGCGGLGLALKERFDTVNYTGIDINKENIEEGKKLNPTAKLLHGDILDSQFDNLVNTFDRVYTFSCIDWNIETDKMLQRAWSFVRPNGILIASLRLTDQESVKDITKSYQFIDMGEIAQYTVFNVNELLDSLKQFNPKSIYAFGYWGNIKSNICTIYDEICFSVFAVQRRLLDNDTDSDIVLNLPKDLLK